MSGKIPAGVGRCLKTSRQVLIASVKLSCKLTWLLCQLPLLTLCTFSVNLQIWSTFGLKGVGLGGGGIRFNRHLKPQYPFPGLSSLTKVVGKVHVERILSGDHPMRDDGAGL